MNTQAEVTKIKTIDVVALEWFDKVNGNSYFAGTVTVNYGLPDAKEFKMPFQYGYGDHYKDVAFKLLQNNGEVMDAENMESLWRWADRHNVIVRCTKHENCKKRELKNI